MDRFSEMSVFMKVVEMRSFRKAAEAVGIPASTVSDVVKRSEMRLGVKLLDRSTRMVSPTLDGEIWYERCCKIVHDVEDAEGSFRESMPEGRLRVDVHGTLARRFLLPALTTFLQANPKIELILSEGDRLVDLVREGIDCVVRVGVPSDIDLVGRKVGTLTEATAASPAYLQRYGVPASPDHLGNHRQIAFLSSQSGRPLPLCFTVNGNEVERSLPIALQTTGAETMVNAARLGLGIVQVPRYHLLEDLEAGRLSEILAEWRPLPSPVYILYPKDRQRSPRVRTFLDWVCNIDFET